MDWGPYMKRGRTSVPWVRMSGDGHCILESLHTPANTWTWDLPLPEPLETPCCVVSAACLWPAALGVWVIQTPQAQSGSVPRLWLAVPWAEGLGTRLVWMGRSGKLWRGGGRQAAWRGACGLEKLEWGQGRGMSSRGRGQGSRPVLQMSVEGHEPRGS